MVGLAGVGEQPGVNHRVEGLDPALEALGEAGELLDLRHGQAQALDEGGGAARRDELHPFVREVTDKVLETGLVEDGDEGPADRADVLRGTGLGDGDGHGGAPTGRRISVGRTQAGDAHPDVHSPVVTHLRQS